MPTYEYVCRECGHELEVFQRMSEDALTDCPACEQAQLRRKIGRGAGIIFKGGGFYETDFKDKNGSSGSASGESGAATGAEASKPSSSESAKPSSAEASGTSAP